jgi:hypothetical protein
MQYITIFHANLNYAYLTEDRYEFVIRRAYEMTLVSGRTVCLRGFGIHAGAHGAENAGCAGKIEGGD